LYGCEKGAGTKSTDRPQNREKSDYSSLFISAILLLAVGLATEGMAATPVQQFLEGMLIGMSIACSIIGFVVFARSQKK
jgi:hypothetical protein